MGTTFLTETTLRTINCCCGGVYAIQERFYEDKKREGETWTCPYCGTGWGFAGNGENARLKKRLESVQREADLQRRFAHEADKRAERARRSTIAHKAAKTRIKNRVANGSCPCCKRNFANLQAHMKTKHPDYTTAKD